MSRLRPGRPAPPVDVAAHRAEPDVRHVQDRVLHLAPRLLDRVQIRAAGRQKLQLHAVQAPDLLPDEFRPVLRRAVGYHQDLPEPFACGLQELDKLLPGKGAVSPEEPLPVQRDQAERDGLGVRSRVRVDAADPLGRVDALPEPRVGYAYRLGPARIRCSRPSSSPLSAAPASCGTTRSSACLLSSRAVPSEPSW